MFYRDANGMLKDSGNAPPPTLPPVPPAQSGAAPAGAPAITQPPPQPTSAPAPQPAAATPPPAAPPATPQQQPAASAPRGQHPMMGRHFYGQQPPAQTGQTGQMQGIAGAAAPAQQANLAQQTQYGQQPHPGAIAGGAAQQEPSYLGESSTVSDSGWNEQEPAGGRTPQPAGAAPGASPITPPGQPPQQRKPAVQPRFYGQ